MQGQAVIDMVRGTKRNRIARILRNQPLTPTRPEDLADALAQSLIRAFRERLVRA